MNMVSYERGRFELFFYKRVCYEVVFCERELLWTSFLGKSLF